MNFVEGIDTNASPIFGGGDDVTTDSTLIAAAHELKTPLVLLRQLALQLGETDDETAKNEIIRRMRLTSERSLRLVDNLTRAARLGDALFAMEPVQLSGICYDVADELRPLSRALGQSFSIRISRAPTVAVGNRDLLRSLLTGLIDNALQYNSAGRDVVISAKTTRDEAVIAVRDFGQTMDLGEFRKLSDALGRRVMPVSARPLSSGLGLMIADRFAHAMNGRLSVSRHFSGGVTFRAHLPVSAQLSLLEL